MDLQIDKLAGGLRLGKNLTPAKINQILDQRYEFDNDFKVVFEKKVVSKIDYKE